MDPRLSRRRATLTFALAGIGLPHLARAASLLAKVKPRMRVLLDNDFAGDPDGLFQLAHLALSPSVDIPLIVATHLHPGEIWGESPQVAREGAANARTLLGMLPGTASRIPVLAGREAAMATDSGPSPASEAIIREAMRTDTDLPLFYAAGAGLTELAMAWRKEPRIGKRLKLIWIGGGEHEGLAPPPPAGSEAEYNLTIDTEAAQVIFNESDIEIWQVPRDAYRQMLMSYAEIDALGKTGPVGAWLRDRIAPINGFFLEATRGKETNLGETYIMGDNPLVTLTALQSSFQPDPSSSRYTSLPTPRIGPDGLYRANPQGRRPMQVYTWIDTRLTFADMIAKLEALPS